MIRLTQLIDGQAVAAASGRWLELHDPANATVSKSIKNLLRRTRPVPLA